MSILDRVSEATTVADKDIEELVELTDLNDHLGAILFLFEKILKNKRTAKAVEAALSLRDYFGSVPQELQKLVDKEFYQVGMKEVDKRFDKETAKKVYGAF